MKKEMAKVAFTVLLLLPIFCAGTYAAAAAAAEAKPSSGAAGLKEACKKTSDPKFCESLLQQYTSEFADNNADKMGHAAISAALSRAQAARAFMIRESTKPQVTDANTKTANKECLVKVGRGVDSIREAAREFDQMKVAKGAQRESNRKNVVKNIKSSSTELNACYDLLKKDQKKVGGEVVTSAGTEVEEAAQASLVAQTFVDKSNGK